MAVDVAPATIASARAARPRWFEGRWRPGLLRRAARVAFALVAVALATVWIQGSIRHYLPKDWSRAHEFDGLEDYFVARMYLDGKNPYTPEGLAELKRDVIGHPPSTAFWFLPIGHFDKAAAAELMALSTWALLLAHVYLCARALKFPAPAALAVLVFGWTFTTDGMTMHWHAIQLSEQIAFLLTLAWLFLRRNRELPAGMALGAAATLKLFPGLLMLFLLLARRFRAFAAAVVVYLVVAAIMTARFGLSSWLLFMNMQGTISRGWMGNIRNAGLQGIVLRFFVPLCTGNATPIPRATVVAMLIAAALLVAAIGLSLPALRRARTDDPRFVDLPYSVFVLLSAFLNPWIWEHYYVFMIQPAFVFAARAIAAVRGSGRAWLDETTPGAPLARDAGIFALVAAGLCACGALIKVNVYAKMIIPDLYRRNPTPWYHHQLHLIETINWLPWGIILLVGYVALWYFSPGRAQLQSATQLTGTASRAAST